MASELRLVASMPGHDLIVLGASAGGVEAVSALVAGLPADLRAAVCVVVHLRPDTQSHLSEILARHTALPVVAATDRMPLRSGTIHVAVPDLHMLVERNADAGLLRLVRGPRENRTRPAVDPLFRSAALAYGPRVIGVVLSGALDDGTAGLWAVKDRGGIAVVQDPDDAAVPSMPTSARTEVDADHVAPARELGPLLGRLALVPAKSSDARTVEPSQPALELEREIGIGAMREEHHQGSERYGEPSRFSCPDCGGVLWDLSREGPLRFRCEVGHAHSAASLAETQTEAVEAAMWTALRALEDKIELARRRAADAAARGLAVYAVRFTAEEQAAQQHATALRALLRLDARTGSRPRLSADEGRADRHEVLQAETTDATVDIPIIARGTAAMD
jgi:two-component system, chemotaxis family, protein-glutamate methylesterase/glutaminase